MGIGVIGAVVIVVVVGVLYLLDFLGVTIFAIGGTFAIAVFRRFGISLFGGETGFGVV